jgi:hypothetical protein
VSTAFFCVLFAFFLYYPWVCSYVILTPESSPVTAFFAIGSYFLFLSFFLLITLWMAWTDRALRTVERPVTQLTRIWKRVHIVEWIGMVLDAYQLCSISFVEELYPADAGT